LPGDSLPPLRALIPVVTAFTAAHSITVIASAYNLGPDVLWFPPLIETLIAIPIVYMALENIWRSRISLVVAPSVAAG
jgi:hypothetical protein